MALGTWLSAKRHARGFGIHSPFGFRFVTEVLCSQACYYAYRDIPDERRGLWRLFFRICVYFDMPVEALGSDADMMVEIHLKACGSSPRKKGDLLALSPGCGPVGLERLLRADVVFFVDTDSEDVRLALERMVAAADHGHYYTNLRGVSVFVNRPTLPRQDFKVAF